MKKQLPVIITIFASYLIAGCSTEAQKQSTSTYSAETEREFQAIERRDVRINPLYRLNTQESQSPKATTKTAPHEKKEGVNKPPVTTTLSARDTSRMSIKNQERLQEINQNLAFFCMKNRKNGPFKNEQHCRTFTQKALESCEKKHRLINSVMVDCIKNQLKRR